MQFIQYINIIQKYNDSNIKFTIGTLIRISMYRLFFEQTILQLVGFKVKGNRSHLLKEFNFQPEGKINLTIHQYFIKTFLPEKTCLFLPGIHRSHRTVHRYRIRGSCPFPAHPRSALPAKGSVSHEHETDCRF